MKKFQKAKNLSLHGLLSSSRPCPLEIESKDDDLLNPSIFLCLLFEYTHPRDLCLTRW